MNNNWKECMAIGFLILCMTLGVGGCQYLINISEAKSNPVSK